MQEITVWNIRNRTTLHTHLSEAEEDAQTAAQLEGIINFILQQGAAGSATAQRILRVGTALSIDYLAAGLLAIGDAVAGGIEAAAKEAVLHLFTQLGWHRLPALLGELLLLLGVNGQTGAGNRELDEEEHEQNDHVLH